jgi:redox-sensitive bicupin YhaK (pirin superfamily)
MSHKMIGPFIFFDHMGPATLPAGGAIDVRPHPHIGLATITYLFEGALLHRDSLGVTQRVVPGEVNWMTAGRGIVHSERSSPEDAAREQRVHGIQTWVALPRSHEDAPPAFSHHSTAELPAWVEGGARLRLIVGTYDGRRAPTPAFSPIFYVAVETDGEASVRVSTEHAERAVYLLEGDASVDGAALPAATMAVLDRDAPSIVRTTRPSKLVLVGGAPMDGDRFIWWNFVASTRERMEAAKASWREYARDGRPVGTERFPLVRDDAAEWIPLPAK